MNHDNDDYKRDIRMDGTPPGSVPPPHYSYVPHHVKRPNRFWLFVLSGVPGLAHLYMGLIRRGLFYMSLFALAVAFSSTIPARGAGMRAALAGFSFLALYSTAFFEAFKIRREMILGKEIKDAIPNFLLSGNKTVLIAAIAVVAVISALGFTKSFH